VEGGTAFAPSCTSISTAALRSGVILDLTEISSSVISEENETDSNSTASFPDAPAFIAKRLKGIFRFTNRILSETDFTQSCELLHPMKEKFFSL
jgi:hypothetical protein